MFPGQLALVNKQPPLPIILNVVRLEIQPRRLHVEPRLMNNIEQLFDKEDEHVSLSNNCSVDPTAAASSAELLQIHHIVQSIELYFFYTKRG